MSNYLLEAKIKNEKILDFLQNVSQFLEECNLNITSKGIEVKMPDSSLVCYVDAFLQAECFEEYEAKIEQKVGINAKEFVNILKRANDNETISLKISNEKIEINFSNRKFVISTIDVNVDNIDVSKLEYDAKAVISSEIFTTSIDDSTIFSESVIIEINNSNMYFYGTSTTKTYENIIQKNDKGVFTLNGKAKARYSLEYLRKLKKLPEKITLELKTDAPLKISYKNDYYFSLILAPRVEEE